jgi:hypothetical protein
MLVISGVFGVTAVFVVVAALAAGYWNRRKTLPKSERYYLGAATLVIIASTFGANALHGNRVGVLVWALVAVMVAGQPNQSASDSPLQATTMRLDGR